MDTNQNTATLEVEAEGLLAAVKDGQLVLASLSEELTTLESEVDTVEAELAKIDQEFEAGEAARKKELAAMVQEMKGDITEELAGDAEAE